MIKVDWRSCESMSEDVELVKMEEWCKEVYHKWGKELKILEIGSYRGKTAALMAQFGRVWCIDLWSNVEDGVADYAGIGENNWIEFIRSMRRLQLINTRIFPIVSDSNFLDQLSSIDAFDIIFVDGSHKYEYVKNDILKSSRRLKDDGLLIIHDYKRPGFGYPPFDFNHPHHGPVDPWHGVAKATDEFLENNKDWRVKEHFLGIIALERFM